MKLWTVGHSTMELDQLIENLDKNGIGHLIDVRSRPYSKYNPQFNRETIARAMIQVCIKYTWKGDYLGGLDNISDEKFRAGIDWLEGELESDNCCVMCSEGDYHKCHRWTKITKMVKADGVEVFHIKTDGSVEEEEKEPMAQQSLF